MWKNQTTYDDEFRWNAVDLYLNSDRSMAEVAADLGLCAGSQRDLAAEIRRLRKENEHLRRQRDILKKAAAILGEDPHASMR